jgi:hypothetical protein
MAFGNGVFGTPNDLISRRDASNTRRDRHQSLATWPVGSSKPAALRSFWAISAMSCGA